MTNSVNYLKEIKSTVQTGLSSAYIDRENTALALGLNICLGSYISPYWLHEP